MSNQNKMVTKISKNCLLKFLLFYNPLILLSFFLLYLQTIIIYIVLQIIQNFIEKQKYLMQELIPSVTKIQIQHNALLDVLF